MLRILRAALAVYGVLYVGFALYKPARFVDMFAISLRMAEPADLREKAVIGGRIILTCLAVGALVYLAAFAITSVIPEGLVTPDDDGEEHSTRMTVHWALTFFGTLGLIGGCEDSARERDGARLAAEAAKAVYRNRGDSEHLRLR